MVDRDPKILIVEMLAVVVEEAVEQLDEAPITLREGLNNRVQSSKANTYVADTPFDTICILRSYRNSRTGHSFVCEKKTLGNRLKRLGRIGGDIPHCKGR